jgi:transposase
LETWIEDAAGSLLGSFVRGIVADKKAIAAAIVEPWSNGQTEGQITKLKRIKRQMYGRANLDLLRARLCTAWRDRYLYQNRGRAEKESRVAAASPIRVEIVRKLEGQAGFVVHAHRWVVERFFAWINRHRRLAKNVESKIACAEVFLDAASAILLLRRLVRWGTDSKPTLRALSSESFRPHLMNAISLPISFVVLAPPRL